MTLQALVKTAPVTLVLVSLCVSVFVLQALYGVNVEDPSTQDIIRFGANFLPLTLQEPYRLVSAGFVHIGFIHLLFNMFALFGFGRVCETIIGRLWFLLLFLNAVVAGNLASLVDSWYGYQENGNFVVSAGASGGIMGIGTVLLILAFSKHPKGICLNRKNLITVMSINLLLGFVIPFIDNAAHLGGAFCGLVFALVLSYVPKTLKVWAIMTPVSFVFIFGWIASTVGI